VSATTLHRPVLLWEVSLPQRLELHLDISTVNYMRRHVLLLCVSTPKWAELHLYLSTLHLPVLLL
jgi:hypothetical protein